MQQLTTMDPEAAVRRLVRFVELQRASETLRQFVACLAQEQRECWGAREAPRDCRP